MDVSRRHLGGLSLADIAIDGGQLNCGAYVLLGGLEFAIKNCDTTSVYERTSEHPRVWMTFENRFRNVAVTHGFVKVTTLPFQDRNTDVEISRKPWYAGICNDGPNLSQHRLRSVEGLSVDGEAKMMNVSCGNPSWQIGFPGQPDSCLQML
jgi:hypothetical protein